MKMAKTYSRVEEGDDKLFTMQIRSYLEAAFILKLAFFKEVLSVTSKIFLLIPINEILLYTLVCPV